MGAMTFERFFMSAILVIGIAYIGSGVRKWRTGGRRQTFAGIVLVAQAAMTLGSGWVHYVALMVQAPFLIIAMRGLLTTRDRLGLWINVFFVAIILAIAGTETVFDHISLWQRLFMGSIAALAAAALALTIMRLMRLSRTRQVSA